MYFLWCHISRLVFSPKIFFSWIVIFSVESCRSHESMKLQVGTFYGCHWVLDIVRHVPVSVSDLTDVFHTILSIRNSIFWRGRGFRERYYICLDRYIGRYVSGFFCGLALIYENAIRVLPFYLDVSGGALVICLLSGSTTCGFRCDFEWLGLLMTKMPLCFRDFCLALVGLWSSRIWGGSTDPTRHVLRTRGVCSFEVAGSGRICIRLRF